VRKLVVLAGKGSQTFEAAMRLQAPRVNGPSEGLSVNDIASTRRVVAALRKKLESAGEP
jgi:hypothetical protein